MLQEETQAWLDSERAEAMNDMKNATCNEQLWGAKYRIEAAESFANRMTEQVGKGIMAQSALEKA